MGHECADDFTSDASDAVPSKVVLLPDLAGVAQVLKKLTYMYTYIHTYLSLETAAERLGLMKLSERLTPSPEGEESTGPQIRTENILHIHS
jgi:hypothetical protein